MYTATISHQGLPFSETYKLSALPDLDSDIYHAVIMNNPALNKALVAFSIKSEYAKYFPLLKGLLISLGNVSTFSSQSPIAVKNKLFFEYDLRDEARVAKGLLQIEDIVKKDKVFKDRLKKAIAFRRDFVKKTMVLYSN